MAKEWLWTIFGVLFKIRTNSGRRLLIILLVTGLVCSVLNQCVDDTTLLFVKRPSMEWSDTLYGYYVSAKSGAAGLCSILLVPIVSKSVTIHDVTFLIIGLTVKAAVSLLAALSNSSLMVFLSGVVDGPGVMTMTVVQTMVTKVVSPEEVGCVFSILLSLGCVCQVIVSPLIAVVYNSSIATFPGLTLLFIAGVFFVLGLIFLAISSWVKRHLPSVGHSSDTEETLLTLSSTPD